MYWIRHLIFLFLVLVLVNESQADDEEKYHHVLTESSHPKWEQIRSPMLEVLMHLPPSFHDVKSFKRSLGIKSERVKRKTEPDVKYDSRRIVDVRSYEIVQPVTVENRRVHFKRGKREAEGDKDKATLEKPEPEKLVSVLMGSEPRENYPDPSPDPMLPVPDAIRGSFYTPYPVKEFDIVDIDDPDDPRRRRNDSVNGRDDNAQRDKRTFLEGGGGDNGEATTLPPFWKRKKENPPFVTGRGGSVQNGNGYTPPQHRSAENARESHSMKNLDKTVQSNEISRSNQDNYYASTNRRTYSRQSDSVTPSTPKSVYDTIDYSNSKRNQDAGRSGRNYEDKKGSLGNGRVTHEQYNNRQFQYNHPAVYDRPYYQPPYPYPTEVLGRGVEYYHRTYEPSTGRIIYYANMPEQGRSLRSFDYRFMDPINRNFYINRPFMYDPYYRNYLPPFDYRFQNAFGRSMDYMRTGRSSSQAYSYPGYQEREKITRDARFNAAFDKSNRLKDDLRNKTYIIYDADDNRSQFPRPLPSDTNRFGYAPAPNNYPGPQVPFRQFSLPPPADYFSPAAFPFRNQFYPSSPGPFWGFNQRPTPGVTDSSLNSRSINSPEVQLPLNTPNRGLHPSDDKSKQSSN